MKTSDWKRVFLKHLEAQERDILFAKSKLPALETAKAARTRTSKTKKKVQIRIILQGIESQTEERQTGDVHISYLLVVLHGAHQERTAAAAALDKNNIDGMMTHIREADFLRGKAAGYAFRDEVDSEEATWKAKRRHIETTFMRLKVIDHWRKRIDPTLPAQKAADELIGIFQWKDRRDVAHETLARWVSEAKREGGQRK
jgi:hypothetical protein